MARRFPRVQTTMRAAIQFLVFVAIGRHDIEVQIVRGPLFTSVIRLDKYRMLDAFRSCAVRRRCDKVVRDPLDRDHVVILR